MSATDKLTAARLLLPYPIASAVRPLVVGHAGPRERYDASIRVGENLVKLIGALGLALTATAHERPEEAKTWRAALGRGGVSLGLWLGASRGAARAEHVAQHFPAYSDSVRDGKRQLLQNLNTLVEARNRRSHDGPLKREFDIEQRLAAVEPVLLNALDQSMFLSNCQFLLAERSSRQRSEAGFVSQGLDIKGDHPEFERAWSPTREALIEGALYVIMDDDDAVDLSPYIVARNCTVCGNLELFFLDALRGKDLVFKSADSPHEFREAPSSELMWALFREEPSSESPHEFRDDPLSSFDEAQSDRTRDPAVREHRIEPEGSLPRTTKQVRSSVRGAAAVVGLIVAALVILLILRSPSDEPSLTSEQSDQQLGDCNPAYPDVCMTPDIDCEDLQQRNIRVLPPDPFNLDVDGDGIGCEA